MRQIIPILFVLLSSCVDNPTLPVETTVIVAFDTVPHQYYSQDPNRFIGLNVLSTINPPQNHTWCLQIDWFGEEFCGSAPAYSQGGHRFYFERSKEWSLTYRTETESGESWLHFYRLDPKN